MDCLKNQACELTNSTCRVLTNDFTDESSSDSCMGNEINEALSILLDTSSLKFCIPVWKDLLRSMEVTRDEALLSRQAQDLLCQSDFEKRINALCNEKASMERVVNSEALHLQEITATRKKTIENQLVLQDKEKIVKRKEIGDLSRLQATFALYADTFKIRWDYQSSEQEVKGCVVGKKDIAPFSLQRGQHAEIYISNYLWDLVEACL